MVKMALLSTLVVSEITTPPLKPIAIIRYIARYLLICSGISRFDFKQPEIMPNKKNSIGGDNKFSTKKDNNSIMSDIFILLVYF
jgi:hypothetical protein